ncbi:TetM/TetW/TetO/TetS family tetracycline resistance ribosomal protection protein [Phytoactinopolyspora halotolerans]|uniref:TetM/TetW/TetO/TetS family tetracycline resistance ribosomal protection protein n=1 Tax=Phytoactinopolyspora halotolerans TaxID=1981512 RepID=A0A6L9SCQ7_9ACTN|nr:TetM/TetW/TetO/TetS family tetracycline resistance ribosomal protection protein [Phytoactinopolyspora halotolerans]
MNLGILAHVDAGKTSLTERLLYAAGVIDTIGSVDDGNTTTDSLALERQRGITIKSAVVSFTLDDVTVNLIDTPGHPDFIAEVERVLNVLDGAVLVVSAVEGVQPQTRVLMRTLQRLRVPTLIFVNKIDRTGARDDGVLREVSERLSTAIAPLVAVDRIGTRDAATRPFDPTDQGFNIRLLELLAENDDALLTAYVNGTDVAHGRLRRALARHTAQSLVYPVLFGSAITGAGIEPLTAAIRELLPAVVGDHEADVAAKVFKVERGPRGEKVAYVRMHTGAVRTRERVRFGDGSAEAKVTRITVFHQGKEIERSCVRAGQIGKLWGLNDVQVGDAVGAGHTARDEHYFAPPSLEAVVVPVDGVDRGAVHSALAQLAEQDPLIDVRQDDLRQEISVSLYGEVQKEVIQATLADEFGLAVSFRETTTICIERPVSRGWAVETIYVEPNPFLATVGLRVEPAPVGAGVTFGIEFELGALPPAFLKAVEDTVYETLREGLHGWEVTDCRVTMTHSGYAPRQSHAHQGFDKSMSSTGADFRLLTPLVLMAALKEAGTGVFEPMHRFRLESPRDVYGSLAPALASLGAIPRQQEARGEAYVIDGHIPAARVHTLQQRLPALTRGEAVLETAFDHYAPVRAPVPERARIGVNPLDRQAYLLHTTRRV